VRQFRRSNSSGGILESAIQREISTLDVPSAEAISRIDIPSVI
jgi:hypothetical protein